MDNTIDLLQIKIENAKKQLPEDTINAIAAVDWRAAILSLRQMKGYNFEQLADLELETELVLCGLLAPEDYPKEIETRMKISKMEAAELVEQMNNLVFKKIKEELIKNTERKKMFQKITAEGGTPEKAVSSVAPMPDKNKTQVLEKGEINIVPTHNAFSIADAGAEPAPLAEINKIEESREDILKKVENPELIPKIPGPVTPLILQQKLSASVQTPIVKTEHTMENITKSTKTDPYRELPE